MTVKIRCKGDVIANDYADVYDWFGYDYVSPQTVADGLADAKPGEEVAVDINSGGGSVFAASEIYSLLQDYAGPVTINIQGLAASAASVIAMAGDTINMSPTAQIMIHKASTATIGNADDLAHDSEVLSTTDRSIASAYEAKTGLDEGTILQMMSKETWMDAKTALDKGFADNIIVRKQPAVVNQVASIGHGNDFLDKIKQLIANQAHQDVEPENTKETKDGPLPKADEQPKTKAHSALYYEKLNILKGVTRWISMN